MTNIEVEAFKINELSEEVRKMYINRIKLVNALTAVTLQTTPKSGDRFSRVEIKTKENKLSLTGTDGFTLCNIEVKTECAEGLTALVSAIELKTVIDVLKKLPAEFIEIEFLESTIKIGPLELKKIDSSYCKWADAWGEPEQSFIASFSLERLEKLVKTMKALDCQSVALEFEVLKSKQMQAVKVSMNGVSEAHHILVMTTKGVVN